MKKLFVLLAGVIAFTCLGILPGAHAQTTTSKKAKTTTAAPKAPKTTTVAGTVSADEKSFVADKDKKTWEVENPEALKGDAGQHVTIKAQVDAAKDEVTVKSAKVLTAKAPKTKKSTKKVS